VALGLTTDRGISLTGTPFSRVRSAYRLVVPTARGCTRSIGREAKPPIKSRLRNTGSTTDHGKLRALSLFSKMEMTYGQVAEFARVFACGRDIWGATS
jgi:hypothetical protein